MGGGLTTGSIAVSLVEPGAMYRDRTSRLDLRVAKVRRVARSRIEPIVEIFYMMNGAPVLTYNHTCGPNWQCPTSTVRGRMLKLSTRVGF